MSDSSNRLNRRDFLKGSILTGAAGGAMAAGALQGGPLHAAETDEAVPVPKPSSKATLPTGKIGKLNVSRMILGGNLLTHYTHSRDLRYVYKLAAHYNTDEKILETLGAGRGVRHQHAERAQPARHPVEMLQALPQGTGGKIQWIICPTAPIRDDMTAVPRRGQQARRRGGGRHLRLGRALGPAVGQGKEGRLSLIAKAVDAAKFHEVPSGVGCHDLKRRQALRGPGRRGRLLHQDLPPPQLPHRPEARRAQGPYSEYPGYWCSAPDEHIKVMSKVTKPWIAFKIMAAGCDPATERVPWAFNNGADHILVGMFDFEIAQDVEIGNKAIAAAKDRKTRPWCS